MIITINIKDTSLSFSAFYISGHFLPTSALVLRFKKKIEKEEEFINRPAKTPICIQFSLFLQLREF